MRKLLAKIRSLFGTELARLEYSLESRRLRLAVRNLRVISYVGRALIQGKHNERAAALTYFSLLALVPLVAVVFSLFKAFGGLAKVEEQLKGVLLEYLASDSQNQVADWLDHFVKSFRAGAVGTIGMLALLVTLILTLKTVEDALNRTWGIEGNRRWGIRLVVYWSLLTVGPLLLGSSLAITAGFQSSRAVVWAQEHVPLFGLARRLVPVIFTSMAFSAMYLILPAARVRWTAALTGGATAAVIFEIAKSLYTTYSAKSVTASPLYGSLAALPFFIVWLNYSWRILLFGADVAHATQYLSTDPTEETDPRTNQATREEAALRICATIAAAFTQDRPPPATFAIADRLLLPAHLTENLCQHLLRAGLIREAVLGNHSAGFVPARPPTTLTAADVVRVLRHKVGVAHWSMVTDSKDQIDALLGEVEAESMERLAKVTWNELAEGERPLREKIEAAMARRQRSGEARAE